MNKQLLSIMLICVAFASNSQLYTPGPGVTDIDGNTYQTVIIHGREYMAENLRVSKFNNGDLIPVGPTISQNPACYSFQGNSNFDITQGKFYNDAVIQDQRNVCPTNWNIPTETELEKTFFYVAQNFQLFNDLDSVLYRSLSISEGGSNEAGLNLLKGNYGFFYDPILQIQTFVYDSINTNLPFISSESNSNSLLWELSGWGSFSRVRCVKNIDSTLIPSITIANGSGVSDIDGNNYGSVVFGNGQEWMTSNLKSSRYKNGVPIPMITTNNEIQSPGWCNYNYTSNYDNIYGKLYVSYTVINEFDNICPSGWKVPALYEWLDLVDYLGGETEATILLKSTSGWGNMIVRSVITNECDSVASLNGTNYSQMNIKPGGWLGDSDEMLWINEMSLFWTATHDPIGVGGPFGMFVGEETTGFDTLCGVYLGPEYLDPLTGSFVSDTIGFIPATDAIATINQTVKVELEYPEAGYMRCMRQSNGVGAVQTIEIQPTYTVYPNPAKDFLNVELNGINPSFYVVFDAFGRELLKDKLQQKLTPISIENLDSGCYFIQVEGQSQITRFIKN